MTASLWKPGIILADSIGEALAVEEYFTATAGQTVFTLSNIVYTPGGGHLIVFKNGAQLVLGVNYTETSSSSVTLVVGAVAGDRIGFVLTAALNATTGSPAYYAALARAAADSAIYYGGLIAGMASKDGVQQQSYNYYVSVGSPNIPSVTLNPIPAVLNNGFRLCLVNPTGTNTSTSVILDLGVKGAWPVKKRNSSGVLIPLDVGDIVVNIPYDYVYSTYGASHCFELVGTVLPAGNITFPEINILRQQLGVI